MFYCESCEKRNSWTEGLSKSYGPCEICGKLATCSDVPSKDLPRPEASIRETNIDQTTGLHKG